MKIAAWNVNSLKVRLPHLTDWLAKTRPDIVCLQELKLEDPKFPRAELEAAGYQAAVSGQKTYNGVAILARAGLSDVSVRNARLRRRAEARHRRDRRRRARDLRLLPQRTGRGLGEIRLQAALVRGPEGVPGGGNGAPPAACGGGRFQRRAGRPRRARSEGLGGSGARLGAGTRRPARAASDLASRIRSACSSSRKRFTPGGTTG